MLDMITLTHVYFVQTGQKSSKQLFTFSFFFFLFFFQKNLPLHFIIYQSKFSSKLLLLDQQVSLSPLQKQSLYICDTCCINLVLEVVPQALSAFIRLTWCLSLSLLSIHVEKSFISHYNLLWKGQFKTLNILMLIAYGMDILYGLLIIFGVDRKAQRMQK